MSSAPKNWRQWLPLDVDDFLTSEDILTMTSDEFKGYMLLILQQWRSDDGYLPNNEEVMRKRSRLSATAWAGARDAIMAKFEETEHGYSNPRCRIELDKILEKFQAKQRGAEETNRKREEKKRSPFGQRPQSDGHRTQNDGPPSPSPSYSPSHSQPNQVPGSEQKDQKGSVGEGLEKTGKAKSSLLTGEEAGLENSVRDSAIFTNSPHVPDTDPIELNDLQDSGDSQDDSGDTGVPPNSQQSRVEAPATVKATPNQPSSVCFGDWPESAPDGDTAITNLLEAHPRPATGYAGRTSAIDAVVRETAKRGKGHWEAYCYLLDRTKAYKAATDGWPSKRKGKINGSVSFYDEGVYAHDDAIWNDDAVPTKDSDNLRDQLIREALEGGGNSNGGGQPIRLLGAEDLRIARKNLRDSFAGPRTAGSYPRPR